MQVKKIAEEEGDGSPFKLLEKDITKCVPSLCPKTLRTLLSLVKNSKPETRNPKLETLNLKPYTKTLI